MGRDGVREAAIAAIEEEVGTGAEPGPEPHARPPPRVLREPAGAEQLASLEVHDEPGGHGMPRSWAAEPAAVVELVERQAVLRAEARGLHAREGSMDTRRAPGRLQGPHLFAPAK